MMIYKDLRIIDGKPRNVIVDETGNIVNKKPSKEEIRGLDKFHQQEMGRFHYKDKELLDDLIRFKKENGRSPIVGDFENNPKYPSPGTYINRFGSWSNAIKRLNQEYTQPNIQMLISQEKFDLLDTTTYKDLRIIDGKPRSVIVDETGNIVNKKPSKEEIKGLHKFYEQTIKGFHYTDEELLGFLRCFYEKEGRLPVLRDFDNSDYPSYSTYQKRFGSWSNALKQVDLDVDSMIRKGIIETYNQKARLAELIVKYHFRNRPIDLAGENCCSPCDGICPNGKTYDVKSSSLRKEKFYCFTTGNEYKEKIDIYYFLGFNKDYTILEHAWRVPGEILKRSAFRITKICSKRRCRNIENMREYEITDRIKEIIKEKI